MSKREYQEWLAEFKNQSAKIPFHTYVKILEKEYGIIEEKRSHSGGSKRSFTIPEHNFPFVIHEPHKTSDPVGKWDHQNVLNLLKQAGLLNE